MLLKIKIYMTKEPESSRHRIDVLESTHLDNGERVKHGDNLFISYISMKESKTRPNRSIEEHPPN